MSATIQSFDLLMALYHQKLSLFEDIQKLKQIAKQARWSSIPDFHHILIFKEQAIIVKTPKGEIVFTSKNMDRFMMQLLETHQLYQSKNFVHQIEIYNKQLDWLDKGYQLKTTKE